MTNIHLKYFKHSFTGFYLLEKYQFASGGPVYIYVYYSASEKILFAADLDDLEAKIKEKFKSFKVRRNFCLVDILKLINSIPYIPIHVLM